MGNPYAPKPPGAPAPRPVTPAPEQDGQPGQPGADAGNRTGGTPDHPHGPGPDQPSGALPGPYPSPPAGSTTPTTGHRPTPGSPRPPVDPEKARLATRSVMVFGLFMLASLLLSAVALPWRMLSVAVGIVALVVGIRALRTVWRAGLRGGLVVVLSAGMAMTVVLTLSTLAVIPVWQIETDRQTCLGQAITLTAESSCQTAYETAIDDYRSSLTD